MLDSTETQLEQVELSISQAKDMIGKDDALGRLYANKDFQEIITKGYFEEEARRAVMTKAHPAMQTEEHQEAIIKKIDSIGNLQQYFNVIGLMATNARKALHDDELTREELLAENV